MVLLGLLLVAAAVATGAVVASEVAGEAVPLAGVVTESGTLPAVGLLMLGVTCGLVGLTGLLALLDGSRRRRAKRLSTRHAVAERVDRADELEQENERLQARLEEERAQAAAVDPYPEDGGHREAVRADVTAGDATDSSYQRDEDLDRDWRRR